MVWCLSVFPSTRTLAVWKMVVLREILHAMAMLLYKLPTTYICCLNMRGRTWQTRFSPIKLFPVFFLHWPCSLLCGNENYTSRRVVCLNASCRYDRFPELLLPWLAWGCTPIDPDYWILNNDKLCLDTQSVAWKPIEFARSTSFHWSSHAIQVGESLPSLIVYHRILTRVRNQRNPRKTQLEPHLC
jgi:hypothetical protein